MINRTYRGDCRELMHSFAGDGVQVQCIVTSPPYWGLRDYGTPGQIGLERTWQRHLAVMRSVFRLARELLKSDGTLWLNYGDSYYSPRVNGGIGANSKINGQGTQEAFRDAQRARNSGLQQTNLASASTKRTAANRHYGQRGIKPKDLVGMPWRVAFALQADGWYLRSDVIWHKPNPMPESVYDRPTKAHEYVFLLSRSEHYHYDAAAIAEPTTGNAHARGNGVNRKAVPVAGWASGPGSHEAIDHAQARTAGDQKFGRVKQNASFSAAVKDTVDTRNVRSVWTIPTQPYSGAHFATFPEALVERCILASTRPGDVVLDPFMGSGTVAQVAESLGRQWIGCELSPEYLKLAEERETTMGLPL